jgi:hypothetical protein
VTHSIFVPGVGQYDNIGDIVLRRQLIDWLRPLGRLHVYLGRSPDGYAEGLGLEPDDVTYRSFGSWYRAGLASALRGDTSYVFKPGEIQLTIVGMKEHIAMVPLALLVRLRRGSVIRVGVGSRNFSPLPRLLMAPSIALSQLTRWRDPRTAEYLGGATMPDLAFGQGSASPDGTPPVGEAVNGIGLTGTPHRRMLAVEMRDDRPYPSPEWIEAVRAYAAEHDLDIVAVTQVLRDSDRSRALALDLSGSTLDWDGTGHRAQERLLRELYRNTRVVISDRLHVLVTALTEGAVPVAALVDSSDKIDRHFVAAGIEGVSFATSNLSAAQIESAIGAVVGRSDAMFAALASARDELDLVRRDIENAVSGSAGYFGAALSGSVRS